jgi:hypothetical protein
LARRNYFFWPQAHGNTAIPLTTFVTRTAGSEILWLRLAGSCGEPASVLTRCLSLSVKQFHKRAKSSTKDDASLLAAQIFQKEMKHMTIRNSQKTRSLSSYLTLIFTLTLLITMLTGVIAPAAQVVQQKAQKAKPQMTMAQRFEQLAARSKGENPLLPVMMHALERYVEGKPAESKVDQAVRNAMSRHPKLTKPMVQQAVNNWKAIPEATKAKLVPAELRNLSANQKLDTEKLRTVMNRRLSGNVAVKRVDPIIRSITPTAKPYKTPEGTTVLQKGTVFQLEAKYVPTDKSKIKIHFLKASETTDKVIATISPSVAKLSEPGVTGMLAIVPKDWPGMFGNAGHLQLQIEVTGGTKSNKIEVYVPTFKFNFPIITSLAPAAQYPGSKVTINAENYTNGVRDVPNSLFVRLENVESGYSKLLRFYIKNNSGKLEQDIPQDVPPGKYRIVPIHKENVGPSKDFTVRAPQYQVRFEKMECGGWPEQDGCTSDGVVTISTIYADGQNWAKTSTKYGPFRNHPVLYYSEADRYIYPASSKSEYGKVGQYLFIVTKLYVWTLEGAQIGTELLSGVEDVTKSVLGAAGYGWVVSIREWVEDLIGMFHCSIMDCVPNVTERHDFSWSAVDLQKGTAGKGWFFGEFSLTNTEHAGSYRVSYTVSRYEAP